jgi:hypothetical protein
VELQAAGHGKRRIAEELGVTQASAAALLRSLGVSARHADEHALDPEQQELLVGRYLAGEGLRRLAAAFDLSDRAVRGVLEEHGVAPRPPGRPWASVVQAHAREARDRGAPATGTTAAGTGCTGA